MMKATQTADVDKLMLWKPRGNQYYTYRPNNWLKHHKKPMRRKPFKKNIIFFDEAHLFYTRKTEP